MPIRKLCSFAAICCAFISITASADQPAPDRYVQLQVGSVQFDRRPSQSLYSGSASWSLGSWGFARLHRAHASGSDASFERTRIDLGFHHALSRRSMAFASIGAERLASNVNLPRSSHSLQSNHSGIAAELGWQLQPAPWFAIALAADYSDRERDILRVNLPDFSVRLGVEGKINERFSLVFEARSGEDYREYLIGPRLVF